MARHGTCLMLRLPLGCSIVILGFTPPQIGVANETQTLLCPIARSLVPLIALHEADAEFELRPVSLKSGEQKTPEYLKVNRKGRSQRLMSTARS
ncbi:MAG: hypothetical protein EXR39_06650 [Betaproteobacteria bacterium]|nr:hypothetical protein [Betaproteobacteria bacterium]